MQQPPNRLLNSKWESGSLIHVVIRVGLPQLILIDVDGSQWKEHVAFAEVRVQKLFDIPSIEHLPQVGCAELGATLDQVLPDLEGSTFARALLPVVAHDAMLVSDGRAAYGQFADAAGLLHISLNDSKGERVFASYHIQNVNAYISRLKGWLHRFRGVATKYLQGYLG